MLCRVCGFQGSGTAWVAREMMLGLGETFDYDECGGCGSLAIRHVPADLARFYPSGYYSFDAPRARPRNPLVRLLRRLRDRAALGGGGPLERALLQRFPYPELAGLAVARLRPSARILDIGSGGGNLLLALREAGFAHVEGIDPFLERDIDLGGGVRLHRSGLAEWTGGPYDLVMFHHSLEHVPDPAASLEQAARRLAPGGACLIRTPTVSSFAWRTYRADWVQLDAPRHLTLFSRAGLSRMAETHGWTVESVRDDSTAFQFWGSEQYRAGVPLLAPNSFAKDRSVLDPARLAEQAYEAEVLNGRGDGDQVAVLLRRASAR